MPCDNGLDDCEVCSAIRQQATRMRQDEIGRQLESISQGDHVGFSEMLNGQLIDTQQKVSAYFADTDLCPTVVQATKVENAKLERRFLTASQRCESLEDVTEKLILVASAAEAKAASEVGLAEAVPSFRKYLDICLAPPKDAASRSIYLLCRVQLGRVYECGVRSHKVPFSKKTPSGFDCTYDSSTQTYRLWTASRVLPVALVHVETCAKAIQCTFPLHWSAGDTPAQGWRTVPVKDRSTLDLLQACLATDGSQLGRGRDVVESGHYSRLELALAWRIQHPSLWQRYEIERESINTQIGKRSLRIPQLQVRRDFYNAAKRLPGELNTTVMKFAFFMEPSPTHSSPS